MNLIEINCQYAFEGLSVLCDHVTLLVPCGILAAPQAVFVTHLPFAC